MERVSIINDKYKCPLHAPQRVNTCSYCKDSISITHKTLRLWYLKEGIRYLVPPYRLTGVQTEDEILKMQQTFVMYLYFAIQKKAEVIYLDEASVDCWQSTKRKAWLDPK